MKIKSHLERLFLTIAVLIGYKQNPKLPTKQVFLADGRKVTVLITDNKKSIVKTVIPMDAMSYPDWWTYVRQRHDIDPEGPTVTKYYL